MPQDWIALIALALYCLAFAAGSRLLWKGAFSFSFALLTLVTLSSTLGLFGIPSVHWLQPLILGIAAIGLFQSATFFKKLNLKPAKNHLSGLILVIIAGYGVWFWMGILSPLVSLPSYHDGIAHTLFFTRILETGLPLVTRIPMLFQEALGPGQMSYYPAGTHVIVASFSWFLVQLGVEPTSLLKSFLVLANAAIPLLAYATITRAFVGIPKWIPLLIAWVMISYYPLPIWATDQGGFSRILAYAITIPAILMLLTKPSNHMRAVLIAVGAPGTFLIHPGAFVLFGVAVAASIGADLKKMTRKEWTQTLIGALGGAVLLAFFILESQRNVLSTALDHEGKQLAFSISTAWSRIGNLTHFTFTDFFQPKPFPSIKSALWLVGAASLIPVTRRFATPMAFRTFALAMPVVGIIFLMFVFFSSPLIRTAGLIFYHLEARVSETLFILQALLAGAGAWTISQFFAKRRNFTQAAAAGLIIWAMIQHVPRVHAIEDHFNFWFREYQSPMHAEFAPLITFLKEKTEKDAVLIYPQFEMDIVPAATGRRGIFTYGECPSALTTENCNARKALSAEALKTLRERMLDPTPNLPCAEPLLVFGTPTYIISKATADVAPVGDRICRDLELLQAPAGFRVGRTLSTPRR